MASPRRAVCLFLGSLIAALPSAGAQDRVTTAYDAYRTGEYDVAVSILSSVLRSEPSIDATVLLGRVLRETGRYQEAEELLRKSTATDNASLALATQLGEVLLATGRTKQAMEQFRRVTDAGSAGPFLAHLRVAEIHIQRGERRKGTDRLNWIVAQYAGGRVTSSRDLAAVAAALEHLGRSDTGRFRQALRVYDQAIAADSTNLDAQVAGGDLFLSKYQGIDARAMYQLALSRNPNHPAADAQGYVLAPNVTSLIEMMDMREAQRSYEANLNVIKAAKSMLSQTIDILR